MIEIKIVNQSSNPLPLYQTEHAAGIDLMAFLPEPIVLEPMQRALITTGLFIEIPPGYEAQIRPRSGLALKHGITVLNAPGTIDADYRGAIKVLLVNFGEESFVINNGERIAQMVLSKHEIILWKPVEHLTPSSRGEGGYGSTGK